MRAVCKVISPPHHVAYDSCSSPPHLLCLAVWQHHPKHTCTPKGIQSWEQPAETPTQVEIWMLLAVAAYLFNYGPASRGLAGPRRKAVTELQGSCSQKDLGSNPVAQVTPSVQEKEQRSLVDFSMRATCSQDLDVKLCLLFQAKFPALWTAFVGTEGNPSLALPSLPPSPK